MGVLGSWRTADGRWEVEQLFGEDVAWRIWHDGVLAAELRRPQIEALAEYLSRQRVDLDDLIPQDEWDNDERE